MDFNNKKLKSIFNFVKCRSGDEVKKDLASNMSFTEKRCKNKIKTIVSIAVLAIFFGAFFFSFKRPSNENKSELKSISTINNDLIEDKKIKNSDKESEDVDETSENESSQNKNIFSEDKKQKVLTKNKIVEDKKIVKGKSNDKKHCENDLSDNDSSLSEESNEKSSKVYITDKGSCYHYKKCGKGNYHLVSLNEAKGRGLRPCKRCCK